MLYRITIFYNIKPIFLKVRKSAFFHPEIGLAYVFRVLLVGPLLGIDAFGTGLTKADLSSEQRELKFLLSYIMTSSSEMIIGDNIFSDTLNAYFDKALINSHDMVDYSDRWRTYNGVIARSKGEGSDINLSLAKSMCEIYLNDTSSTSTHQVTELISELSSAYSKVLLEFKPQVDKELKRLS